MDYLKGFFEARAKKKKKRKEMGEGGGGETKIELFSFLEGIRLVTS